MSISVPSRKLTRIFACALTAIAILTSPIMNAQSHAQAAPTLNQVWETSGFEAPESIAFDRASSAYYVSNMGQGGPMAKDGNGYIAKVDKSGKIETKSWIPGLNAPKGVAILGKNLYVADIDQVIVIDIANANIVKKIEVPGAVFLNDVAVDAAGSIFVSDTIKSEIFRIIDGKAESWLADSRLEQPNGLLATKTHLIVAAWGVITDPATFGTKVPGHIKSVSFADKSIKSLGDGSPVGNLDGITAGKDGSLIATNWLSGEILHQKIGEKETVIGKAAMSAADHTYIGEENLLVVPITMQGKVIAYKLN